MIREITALRIALILLAGCSDSSSRAIGPHAVTYSALVQVVPNTAFPPEVKTDRSNNNLDIIDFEGRLFLVFRTAPTHFASPEAAMYILSTKNEKSWALESKFTIGSDLREPRFFTWKNTLYLYFAELGKDPTAFEPGKMWRTQRVREGQWTEPEATFEPDFIPWRIKIHDGRPKRCAIWTFNRAELRIEWIMDLPLKGDTCFPTAIPRGEGTPPSSASRPGRLAWRGTAPSMAGRFLLYNYSSDINGPDSSGFQAQLANTYIYSTVLTFR